jgi:hypothetical protein
VEGYERTKSGIIVPVSKEETTRRSKTYTVYVEGVDLDIELPVRGGKAAARKLYNALGSTVNGAHRVEIRDGNGEAIDVWECGDLES